MSDDELRRLKELTDANERAAKRRQLKARPGLPPMESPETLRMHLDNQLVVDLDDASNWDTHSLRVTFHNNGMSDEQFRVLVEGSPKLEDHQSRNLRQMMLELIADRLEQGGAILPDAQSEPGEKNPSRVGLQEAAHRDRPNSFLIDYASQEYGGKRITPVEAGYFATNVLDEIALDLDPSEPDTLRRLHQAVTPRYKMINAFAAEAQEFDEHNAETEEQPLPEVMVADLAIHNSAVAEIEASLADAFTDPKIRSIAAGQIHNALENSRENYKQVALETLQRLADNGSEPNNTSEAAMNYYAGSAAGAYDINRERYR